MNLQERKGVEDLEKSIENTLNNYLKTQGCNKRVYLNPPRLNFKFSQIRYYAFRKYSIVVNPYSPSARKFLQKWILKRKQTIWRRLNRFVIQASFGRYLYLFPSLIIETEKEAAAYLKDAIIISHRFLKLIDFKKGTITSILKTNVNKAYLKDEVKARKILSDSNHIPKLIAYDDKENFYIEEFFDGIPLNHHTIPKSEKITVLKEIIKTLSVFYKRMGHKQEELSKYLVKRENSIQKSFKKIGSSPQGKEFLELVKELLRWLKDNAPSSTTILVYSPGDRKLEQILYNPYNKSFQMIDWESLSPLISITHDVFQLLEGLFGKGKVLRLINNEKTEQDLIDLYDYSLETLNLKGMNSKFAYGIYFMERIDGNFGWISSTSWKSENIEKMISRWINKTKRYFSFLSIC